MEEKRGLSSFLGAILLAEHKERRKACCLLFGEMCAFVLYVKKLCINICTQSI